MQKQKKRKGYYNIFDQMEANKRYLENHPEAKERRKISNYKSNTKTFIKKYATKENLIELRNLIEEILKEF